MLIHLPDGRLIDPKTNKIIQCADWVLRYPIFYTGKGAALPIISTFRQLEQERDGFTCVIKVMCESIKQHKRSVYAKLSTKADSASILIEGNRKIESKWVRFNHNFIKDTAFMMLIRKSIAFDCATSNECAGFEIKSILEGV